MLGAACLPLPSEPSQASFLPSQRPPPWAFALSTRCVQAVRPTAHGGETAPSINTTIKQCKRPEMRPARTNTRDRTTRDHEAIPPTAHRVPNTESAQLTKKRTTRTRQQEKAEDTEEPPHPTLRRRPAGERRNITRQKTPYPLAFAHSPKKYNPWQKRGEFIHQHFRAGDLLNAAPPPPPPPAP